MDVLHLGDDELYVGDPSTIPAEAPPELMYEHRVGLWHSAKNLWAHREIVYTLAERDFRAQYKQATLGIMWALLSPLATLAIFVVVFNRVHSFPHQGIPYPLYAFTGILCWSFFASSVGGGGQSLLANKALLAKTQFPRECFPLETMLGNALSSVISWIPLGVLFVIFAYPPKLATLWSPLLIVIEVAFTAGVTLAVSALIIQARDLAQVLPIMISLGIFLTPVIWPFSYVPTSYHLFGGTAIHGLHHHVHWVGGFSINLQAVYGFVNPLGPVIANLRNTMLLGQHPSWIPLLAAMAGAATYLYVGYRIFKRLEVHFADVA